MILQLYILCAETVTAQILYSQVSWEIAQHYCSVKKLILVSYFYFRLSLFRPSLTCDVCCFTADENKLAICSCICRTCLLDSSIDLSICNYGNTDVKASNMNSTTQHKFRPMPCVKMCPFLASNSLMLKILLYVMWFPLHPSLASGSLTSGEFPQWQDVSSIWQGRSEMWHAIRSCGVPSSSHQVVALPASAVQNSWIAAGIQPFLRQSTRQQALSGFTFKTLLLCCYNPSEVFSPKLSP